MPKVIWSQTIDGNTHKVELFHGYFSGKKKVFLDEKLIVNEQTFKDFGGVFNLKIENRNFRITVEPNFLSWIYKFEEVKDGAQ